MKEPKTIILAVDTTEDVLSIALAAGGAVFARDARLRAPHDQALFPAVERLLARAGLGLEDVSAFAAASGPGRFTGIRVGMTFCAVAAAGLKVPALALSRLSALAFGAPGRRVCAVIPGWKDERYYQVFERGRSLKAAAPPVWATPEGWAAARPGIESGGAAVVEARPGARELLALAAGLLARGDKAPPFAPLYLKPAGYELKTGPAR